MPLVRLRDALDHRVPLGEQAPHVPVQERHFCDAAEDTQRRVEVEDISNDGCVAVWL